MGQGAEWIKKAYKAEMSEFGEEVADLLWKLFSGIYHIDSPSLRRVDWSNPFYVIVPLPHHSNELATYDFDLMTKLVVASHDLCIRIAAQPHTFRMIKFAFHKRQRADGQLDISRRMPTLEDHAADIRERLNL